MRTSAGCTTILLLAWLGAHAGHIQAAEQLTREGNVIRHQPSGWQFPAEVAGLPLKREPAPVPGTQDLAAGYEDESATSPMRATVFLYPASSEAADASFAGARAALESSLKGGFLVQSWSEGAFRAGGTVPLVGNKAFYKNGLGPNSTLDNLYYFDTGRWVVKIRISAPILDQGTSARADAFVRALPWDSLALSPETCAGASCRTSRALPAHGQLIEMLLLASAASKLDLKPDRNAAPCDPAALREALAQEAPPPPTESVLARCSLGSRQVSLVRVLWPDKVLVPIEQQAPDGLSLRNPLFYLVLHEGKRATLTELHDGTPDTVDLAQMLGRLGGKAHHAFATGDAQLRKPTPVMRTVE